MDQLKIFKEISKLVTTYDSIPRALVDKFFTTKVKHPIKNAIQNAFKQINDEHAVRIIIEEIEKKIVILESSSVNDQYYFISCLNEASQSFKIVLRAISEKSMGIINFLISVLTSFFNELKANASPSEKGIIAFRIHSTIQAILCCIKNCIESSEKFVLISQFKIIADLCLELLTRDDILIDTKNVCGMLIVMRNNLCNESAHMDIIRDENEDCIKRLCLISGATLIGESDAENFKEFCEVLEKIYMENSVDGQIVIAISLLFMQISKKLQDIDSNEYKATKIIINFSFSNIEHSVDLIRHQVKACLKNLLEIKNENISEMIFERISSLSSIAVQAIVIQSILSATSIESILTRLPNIQSAFLTSLHKYKENIFSCYEVLSSKYYDEVQSFEKWHGKIIQPIIDEMNRNCDGRGGCFIL